MTMLARTKVAPAKAQRANRRPKGGGAARAATLDFTPHAMDGATTVIDMLTGRAPQAQRAVSDALRAAMDSAQTRPVPRQDRLEAHFNAGLDRFGAVWSADIARILDSLGAEAAVIGDRMALRAPDVSLATLLHETAHLLQTVQASIAPQPVDPDAATAPTATPQAEAEARAAETAPVAIRATLDPHAVALRQRGDAAEAQTEWEARQAFRTQSQQATPAPVAETAPPATPDVTPNRQEGPATTVDAAIVTPDAAPQIESELPPLTDAQAAAAQAVDISLAALAQAVTPEGLMQAFVAAPPSVKAAREPTLSADLAALAQGQADAVANDAPDFAATLQADDAALPDATPVTAPAAEAVVLEPNAPQKAPKPDIAPTPTPGAFRGNANLTGWRAPRAGPVGAGDVAQAIGRAQTTDPGVTTSAGPAPVVPLQGDCDPLRATDQALTATAQAAAQRDAAVHNVLAGPGPEQVQPMALDMPVPLAMQAAAVAVDSPPPVAGMAALGARALDSQTLAIFDSANGPAMQGSLATADAQMTAMAAQRDSRQAAATAQAQQDATASEVDANAAQVRHVTQARKAIQTERQTTVDSQHAAVAEMSQEAANQNRATQAEIGARVAADEATIATAFADAEADAQTALDSAETEAEAERVKAAREAEDESWWDAAVDFVADALAKLGDLIGEIFDAVRRAITVILDKVKAAAFALIDAAATFIKNAIAAYGALLQMAVTHLVGSIFPELAKTLNAAIRAGVALAQQAVDSVAEGLKAAVTLIVDTYKAALLAVVGFVEGALNTVVAIGQAALTGDWGEVARLILEPILAALGIDKAAFYQFVGNTLDAITKIIDDPIQFLKNLLAAVVGGFRKFGENFVDHLIAGIIGWLTGAFAGGLTLPAKFDLMGVLDIARQILGLTLDMLRRVAVRILGEAAVEKIEFFLGYAQELITGGWSAFFDKVKQDLSSLFDMVLGQITRFLTERVVQAGIVWLASLFNPAGALVKVVMMIWDAIMWLKDNLARMIAVVQTVVQGMIDIANGNTTPASLKIEQVLAGLLAPTIDLIARLIGLGNVAGRVQEIFQNIRQTIEDAIVKLINAVLAGFRGGGSAGGGGPADGTAQGGDADLMQPMRFSGGGETHTLFARENGADVVPFMQSTPQPVATWLTSLRSDAGVRVQLARTNPAVTDQQVADTKTDIADLVTLALREETQMDSAGEAAQDAQDTALAQSADEVAELAKQAQETAAALSLILEALGLTDLPDFKTVFKGDIDAMAPAYAAQMTGTVNSRINADPARKAAYTAMTWAQVQAALISDTGILIGAWQQPLHAGGVLRDDAAFQTVFFAEVNVRVDAVRATLGIPASVDYTVPGDLQTDFWRPFLADAATAAMHARLLRLMLSPTGAGLAGLVAALRDPIDSTIQTVWNSQKDDKEDYEFKEKVKAASFRENGIFETTAFLSERYQYFEQQDAVGKGVDGTVAGTHDIGWFLTIVPTGSTAGSKRAQKNITHTANMIREAQPGQHEWILASMANAAIVATINQLGQGGAIPAEGFANFVQFQNEVRTQTSKLIFAPEYTKATNSKTVAYITRAHLAAVTAAHTAATPEQMAAFYAAGPAFQTPVATLQAHAGGLRVVTLDASGTGVDTQASEGSSAQWHADLREKVSGVLGASGSLDLADMQRLGKEILTEFDATIFAPGADTSSLTSAGAGYALYQFTGDGATSTFDFQRAVDIATDRQEEARRDLVAKINHVIQPLSVS